LSLSDTNYVGGQFTFTQAMVGKAYTYTCNVHPAMQGSFQILASTILSSFPLLTPHFVVHFSDLLLLLAMPCTNSTLQPSGAMSALSYLSPPPPNKWLLSITF